MLLLLLDPAYIRIEKRLFGCCTLFTHDGEGVGEVVLQGRVDSLWLVISGRLIGERRWRDSQKRSLAFILVRLENVVVGVDRYRKWH